MALSVARGQSRTFSGRLREQLRGAEGIYPLTAQALGLLDKAFAEEWREPQADARRQPGIKRRRSWREHYERHILTNKTAVAGPQSQICRGTSGGRNQGEYGTLVATPVVCSGDVGPTLSKQQGVGGDAQ